jgi:putative DNA primase/helicase
MTELRILGKSELVLVRSNSITIANGNNLVIQGDLTRRTVSGRMDAEVERPELLRFDYSPLDDATVNRAELVMAVLTVLRAYHLQAGRAKSRWEALNNGRI